MTSDGTIVAWGYDNKAQVSDTPSGNNFVAIAAGHYHNVALTSDGSLVSWGWNYQYQVDYTPSGNDFIAVAAGFYHSFALKSDGTIVAWGAGRIYNSTYDIIGDTPSTSEFNFIASGSQQGLALSNVANVPEPLNILLFGFGIMFLCKLHKKHR